MAVVCKVAISCWPSVLRTMSSPLASGAYRKLRSRSPGRPVRMVAVRDFSGLTSSAWALAKAEANAATDSLDRGMAGLALQHIKAYRPRFRALCFHAVPDGLPGILWHQCFELAFGPFVVEKGASGVAEERGKLGPGVGRAHIDDADGLSSRTRRPVLRSYQERLSSSVAKPSCTMRLLERSSGSASPRFSRHKRTRAVSSLPIMIRASEPPTNE